MDHKICKFWDHLFLEAMAWCWLLLAFFRIADLERTKSYEALAYSYYDSARLFDHISVVKRISVSFLSCKCKRKGSSSRDSNFVHKLARQKLSD